MERVMELAKTLEPEIVCIDPWYKFHDGVENRAEDVKVTLDLFDQLAEVTGASVLFIHHDAKGQPGDRPIQDRGSGSGVLARDYDWAVTLTPHASEEDTTVIETLTRNYRPQDAFCIGWWDDVNGMAYRFDLRPEVAPTKKTSATRTQELAGFEVVKPLALSLIRDKEIDIAEFRETIRTKAGYGRDRVQRFTAWFIKTSEDPAIEVYEVRGKGKHTKFIGTKEQIDRLRGIS